VLTVGAATELLPPWFGGDPVVDAAFRYGNPTSRQGYESALVYALAERLGFAAEAVSWTPVDPAAARAAGAKDFDIYISQVPGDDPALAASVDLSSPYYDFNDALIALLSNDIADASAISQLRAFELGAVSDQALELITTEIVPATPPRSYASLEAAGAGLLNGQVDGLVVDLPTAFLLISTELTGTTVVGQFEQTRPDEYFSLLLEQDSPLTACVDSALAELRGDGTIDQLRHTWLVDWPTAPVFEP